MRIRPRESTPRLYGFAYFDPSMGVAYVYPIPFNWFVRWGRSVWFAIKFPKENTDEEMLIATYERGLRDGEMRALDRLPKRITNVS